MNFEDVVRKRRMVRHFTDEPVPVETVEHMVELAQRAPSAGFSQGVSFVMVGHGAPDVKSPSLKRGRRKLEDVLHRERW
jgi:nitroreductase